LPPVPDRPSTGAQYTSGEADRRWSGLCPASSRRLRNSQMQNKRPEVRSAWCAARQYRINEGTIAVARSRDSDYIRRRATPRIRREAVWFASSVTGTWGYGIERLLCRRKNETRG